jgi:anti-sigma regulatory factor (Ser/Thr protein kinase)
MTDEASPAHRAATHLPPVRQSPGAARRFVSDTLRRWHLDTAVEAAELLTSELVTNAVLHAGTEVQIILEDRGDHVHIEVVDLNRRQPVPRFTPYDDLQTGRGLTLLDSVAAEWGVDPRERGKAVWFDLSSRPGS